MLHERTKYIMVLCMIVYGVYLISRMYVNTLENRGNNPALIHTKCIQIEPKFYFFVQYIALNLIPRKSTLLFKDISCLVWLQYNKEFYKLSCKYYRFQFKYTVLSNDLPISEHSIITLIGTLKMLGGQQITQ